MVQLDLTVEGMTCDSCSNSITRVLSKKDFISDLDVSWQEGYAKMTLNDESKKEDIVNLIERLGYKVVN